MNKLQESFQVDDRRFQALIENSIEGIALVSADGMIVYESPNVRRMMGYYPEELVGRHIFDFLHSGDRAASSDLYARALQQPETPIKGQFRYRHKNGSWRWLEVTCTNRLFDPAINAIVVNFHDVTDRVQAEIAQQASETRLASVIDSVMDAVISLDADQRIILFNEAAEKMFGYQAAEVMGQPLDCLLPPRFRNVHARHIRVFGQTGVTNRVMGGLGVISGLRANGEEFPLEASISQVEIRGEKLYTAILRDITERHRAEAALHQSRERLKLALAASQMGVWEWNLQKDALFWSPECLEILGLDSLSDTLESFTNLLHPEDKGQVLAAVQMAVAERGVFACEFRIIKQNGEVCWIAGLGRTSYNGDDKALRLIGTFQDITKRKQREREIEAIAAIAMALRAAPSRADMLPVFVHQVFTLLQADGVALGTYDAATRETVIDYGHGLWADWTGRSIPPGAGIGRYIMKTGRPYVTNDAGNDLRVAWLALGKNVRAFACVPLMVQDQIVGALLVGRQSPINQEEVDLMLAINDIAANALQRALIVETLEQRVIERTRELALANARLEELDHLKSKFVSDVSHELRTPITNLKLYADLLQRSPPERHAHYISIIREQTARQAQLVEDILDISRLELGAGRIEFKPVAINELLQQVVAAHQPTAEAAGLALDFKPASNLPLVLGESNQLAQVITNLIANGLNYTPSGKVQVSSGLNEQYVVVEVQDTGIGIESEDMPHLFERFYRGSRAGSVRGTGLGLAIVKEIVDLHRGKVGVQSKPGSGSTFQVYLPRATGSAPRSPGRIETGR